MTDYYASVALHGTRVDLLPVSRDHVAGLEHAGRDENLWRWLPTAHFTPGTMIAFVDDALALQARRLAVPFTIWNRDTGQVAGSTRFHFIEQAQRRLEIGVTWIGTPFQRSHVNTETKLLQLWYAFEVLACRRVEWKADAQTSSRARRSSVWARRKKERSEST